MTATILTIAQASRSAQGALCRSLAGATASSSQVMCCATTRAFSTATSEEARASPFVIAPRQPFHRMRPSHGLSSSFRAHSTCGCSNQNPCEKHKIRSIARTEAVEDVGATASSPARFAASLVAAASATTSPAKPRTGREQRALSTSVEAFPDTLQPGEIIEMVHSAFPGAIESFELSSRLQRILSLYGYDLQTSLLATSLCCDEVNRSLEDDLKMNFNQNFHMGGLAGFAFGGVTSFGAMAAHIPQNGHCLIVYGPHVGIDDDGQFGKVHRRGQTESGPCCGSATAAAEYVSNVHSGKQDVNSIPTHSPLDAQQAWVDHCLLPYAERLATAQDPDIELPKALFESQDDLMMQIVKEGAKSVGNKDALIGVLGGIQVNTSIQSHEYFQPLRFDLLNADGEKVDDLLKDLVY